MKTINSKDNICVGFEFLPVALTSDSIEIFHPFSNLANEYFENQCYDIILLPSGSIKISLANLSKQEIIIVTNEIKKLLKDSRQKVINDFLFCKSGNNYL